MARWCAATLHFSWTVTDIPYGGCSMEVGYATEEVERVLPAYAARWRGEPGAGNGSGGFELPDFDMTPGATSGKFFFTAGYMTWGVTVTETHPVQRIV